MVIVEPDVETLETTGTQLSGHRPLTVTSTGVCCVASGGANHIVCAPVTLATESKSSANRACHTDVMGNLSSVHSIVHLMLENRSFDNILGFLYTDNGNRSPNGDSFNGLTGNEVNRDAKGNAIKIVREKSRTRLPKPNAHERYEHVLVQLENNNGGFVSDYATVKNSSPSEIMTCFDPSLIPNLAEICRRYAVCDAWFSSVPSETWPNRAFALCGTASGMENNVYNPFVWRAPTIFERMDEKQQLSWRVYYDESITALTRLQFCEMLSQKYGKNFAEFDAFLHDANAGALPNYAFVEPNFFHNPFTTRPQSDMHPPSDVASGDAFIAKVFNAVVTSPQWKANEVLLIITCDEHGGLFDHVSPPMGAAPPDALVGKEFGFKWDRFGVRVPAVVVSPFVKKGSVFRASGAVPFDHTSVLATIEHRFGIAPLTKRDAVAPDLDAILTEPARTDSATLPAPPHHFLANLLADVRVLANEEANPLQCGMVEAMKTIMAAQQHQGIAPELAPSALAHDVNSVRDALEFFQKAKLATGL